MANAALSMAKFPREAIGLDSWANVHMVHEKGPADDTRFPDDLNLAYGQCKCRREIGRKGIPRCTFPWEDGSDNIDLFPEGFLWN